MEQYRNLQQFKSVKEFDQYRSQLFYTIKDKLSKGILKVWNVLSQRSIEIPGVCWVQIDTIAKDAEVSRSTVERAIRLFKKLGVIAVKETTRPKSGGDGANVYVFQKLGEGAKMKGRQKAETPCPTKDESQISENEAKTSLVLNKNIINNKRTLNRPSWIPEQFFNLLKAHYDNIKDIEEFWRAIHAITYKLELNQQVKENIGISAFKEMKSRRKKLKKPIAYFVGIAKRKAKGAYIRNMFEDVLF